MNARAARTVAASFLWLAVGLPLGWLLRGPVTASGAASGAVATVASKESQGSVASSALSPEQRFQALRERLFLASDAGQEGTVGVTLAQLEPYLALHERNAESLVAAYCLTKDEAVLREALERFPNDPSVLETAYTGANQADRLVLAKRLAEASPDNGFGSLLAAGLLLEKGQADAAVAAMLEAGERKGISDHSVARGGAMREALLSCGFASTEATLGSMWSNPIIPSTTRPT